MERTGFGVRAVLELSGITYRQLDYWARTKLVGSSIRAASGRGSRRVYSFDDLVALRVVARLRSAGVPLQAVRRAVEYLARASRQPLNTLALIPQGKRVFALTDDPDKIVEATAQGQVVIRLDIAPIRRHLEQGVTALRAPREVDIRVRGRTFRAILKPDLEVGGFSVEVPALPGCFSQGDDVADARRMAHEAIQLWLDVASEGDAPARTVRGGRHSVDAQ